MDYIKFTFLDDLLAFLKACENGRIVLGKGERKSYEYIRLVKSADRLEYAIALSKEDLNDTKVNWKTTAEQYGGKITLNQNFDDGDEKHINELLLMLPIRKVPEYRLTQISSLLLACPIETEHADGNTAFKRLFDAWKDVPKLISTESKFYFISDDVRNDKWAAVEVYNVAPEFDNKSFRDKHRESQITTLSPPSEWDGEGCFLYVEWGYEYPEPADFLNLYDEWYQMGGNNVKHNARHIVLCTAGKTINLTNASNQVANDIWYEPIHHIIDDKSYTRTESIYSNDIIENLPVDGLSTSEVPDSVKLVINLKIGEVSKTVGSLNEIEKRISIYEQELERLRSRYTQRHNLSQQEFFPVYVFRQLLDKSELTLPSGLENFLKKPLGELAKYTYAKVEIKDSDDNSVGCDHYIVGEMPVLVGTALAIPSDRTYLCDMRWIEWNLPLYLRSDCSLNINIDEEGLAEKVRKLIGNSKIPNDTKIILAEPDSNTNKGDMDSVDGLRLLYFDPTDRLDQVLCFINDIGQGAPSAALLSGAKLNEAVMIHDVNVSSATHDLDKLLLQRTNDLLAEAEGSWNATCKKIKQILLQARITDVALKVTEEVYKELPCTWVDFVNNVYDTDQKIAEMKIKALEKWNEDDSLRKEQLVNVKISQVNIDEEIENKKKEYYALLPKIRQENANLEDRIKELKKLEDDFSKEKEKLEANKGKLKEKNKEIEEKIEQYRTDIKTSEEQTKSLDSNKRQLEMAIQEQKNIRRKLVNLQTEIKNKQVNLERNEKQCDVATTNMNQNVRDLREQATTILQWISKELPEPKRQPETEHQSKTKKRSFFAFFSRR